MFPFAKNKIKIQLNEEFSRHLLKLKDDEYINFGIKGKKFSILTLNSYEKMNIESKGFKMLWKKYKKDE